MLIAQILAGKGREVVTSPPGATIAEVARLLRAKHIGAVAVTDAGKLCGIISERDLARGLADHGAALLEMRVEQLMTKDVVTCSPGDGIDKLMGKMTEGRFRHLPVIKDGQMVGIISIGDVVKYRLQELETEAHMLHDYIAGGA